jgi:cell division protein FtsI/penicillin-binding protein 2
VHRSARILGGAIAFAVALALPDGMQAARATDRTSTIDSRVQRAAEAAVAPSPLPVDLVALRASTGDVLAYVSRGSGVTADDALVGHYPAGSTFKIVTAAALIERGLSPASPATCPASITVDGKPLTTFDGTPDPVVHTLSDAFAHSCNTAFAALGLGLPPSSSRRAAAQLGLGMRPHLGRAAFAGVVAKPRTAFERAELASDGGATVVSPLAMAIVAATVDSGRLHAPRLSARTPSRASGRLGHAVLTGLRSMMVAAVTNGTASGQGLPVGTHAKTGTAEFTDAAEPRTLYAWMVGYRGDVAFAVLVVGGTLGGSVAGPVAARFLAALG